MEFWSRYSQGEAPSSILSSFDIDPHILGPKRISNIVQRIKKEAERLEGFEDTRKHNAGRLEQETCPLKKRLLILNIRLPIKNRK